MSSGVSGLLDILKTSKYGNMFLGVGILVIFSIEYSVLWIRCRLLGVQML